MNQAGSESRVNGVLSTWLQYSYDRVFGQLTAEISGLGRSEGVDRTTKQSVALGFAPSEFSAARLQYDHLAPVADRSTEHRAALQWIMSIGAHPAHAY